MISFGLGAPLPPLGLSEEPPCYCASYLQASAAHCWCSRLFWCFYGPSTALPPPYYVGKDAARLSGHPGAVSLAWRVLQGLHKLAEAPSKPLRMLLALLRLT